MENTETRLQAIFQELFGLPAGTDISACRQESVSTWDSMAHISLMAAIEGEFGVTIDAGDSMLLTSYDAVRSWLQDHGA
jgi:acyl carrier protein